MHQKPVNRGGLFCLKMNGSSMKAISKTTNGRKKASGGQLLAVSSNPRRRGQQASLSGSSFKRQKNTCVHNMQVICDCFARDLLCAKMSPVLRKHLDLLKRESSPLVLTVEVSLCPFIPQGHLGLCLTL